MNKAYIKAIEYYLPEKLESNPEDDKLTLKIGIKHRHIAGDNEFASDLACHAADKLFSSGICLPSDIDFLIYCTQSPDYLLPSTSCIIQDRLGLPTSIGALDVNLGCSGFVYCLSLAKSLVETNIARNVLLITADTYSKFINNKDRSVKVLFGDGAAATLISGKDSQFDFIGPFIFGTDGKGKNNLIVPAGGLREPITSTSYQEVEDEYGNIRSNTNLYMNGPEIFNFTLKAIPDSFNALLSKANMTKDDYDLFVFHQANKFMLDHLRLKLKLDKEKFSLCIENCGNTVSSSIPIALKHELINEKLKHGTTIMLLGFGVGYSWGACNMIWG